MPNQLLQDLRGQAANAAEIHVGREAGFLVAQAFCDFFLLAVDIALVFGLDFHLFDYQRIGKPGIDGGFTDLHAHQRGVADIRAAQQLVERVLMLDRFAEDACCFIFRYVRRLHPGRFEPFLLAGNGFAFFAEGRPAAVSDQPETASMLGQAHVSVILAQGEPVFGTAGKHAIGLGNPARNQIIDQHAQIGFVAARRPCLFALHLQRGVGAG